MVLSTGADTLEQCGGEKKRGIFDLMQGPLSDSQTNGLLSTILLSTKPKPPCYKDYYKDS